jgi:hypothetical protein
MAGQFTDFWKIIKPAPLKQSYSSLDSDIVKLYSNYSWMQKLMKGASTRFSKYTQFKAMDSDVFINRALDTVAGEMSTEDVTTNLPFNIVYQTEVTDDIQDHVVTTIRTALRHWLDTQELSKRIFAICRETIKYGDCIFFKRSDFKKWEYIDPKDVLGMSLNDDGVPLAYHLRRQTTGQTTNPSTNMELIPAAGVVHFSLSSGMGDNGPYGESILFPAIKAYRHLNLLEEAIIIYRIVRAPERRVFNIDVGNMPPQRAQAYVQAFKNELKQKRIPNEGGGQEKVDSILNPLSINEDFFFAKNAEGRGTTIDTLSSGGSLGEITDLRYFQSRFLQALRIPSSYMRGADDNGSIIQDGKVGVAYIEELNFFKFIQRLQRDLNPCFDKQFKTYLKATGISIDPSIFKLELCVPQDFEKFRQAEVDEKLMSNFNNVKDVAFIASKFKLSRYLGLTEEEIKLNEEMLRTEMCIPDEDIDPRMTKQRMMYDAKYLEGREAPKLSPNFESFVKQTAGEAAEAEEAPPEDDENAVTDDTSSETTSSETPPEEETDDTAGEGEDDIPTAADLKKALK